MRMKVFFLKTGAVDESRDPPDVDLHLTSEDIEVFWISGGGKDGGLDAVDMARLVEEIDRVEAAYKDDPHFRWIPAVTGRNDLLWKLVKAAHRCLEYEQEKTSACRCEGSEKCVGCCQKGID